MQRPGARPTANSETFDLLTSLRPFVPNEPWTAERSRQLAAQIEANSPTALRRELDDADADLPAIERRARLQLAFTQDRDKRDALIAISALAHEKRRRQWSKAPPQRQRTTPQIIRRPLLRGRSESHGTTRRPRRSRATSARRGSEPPGEGEPHSGVLRWLFPNRGARLGQTARRP